MKNTETPDTLAGGYWSALDHLTLLRAQRLFESMEVCSHCRGPSTLRCRRERRGLREMRDECANCLRPWQPADLELGLVRVGGKRVEAAELGMAERVEALRLVRHHAPAFAAYVEPRPRDYELSHWRTVLGLWRLYLRPEVEDFEKAARLARKARPSLRWSTAKVRAEIWAVRAIVERRMKRRAKVIAA